MNFESEKGEAQRKRIETDERERAGHVAEREAFGEVDIDGHNKYVSQKVNELGQGNHSEEIMFQIYKDGVKKNQPFENPSRPEERRFPNDLHALIIQKLELENDEQLRFYTAVGTDIDRKYGTDAFFELDVGDGETIDVTLDITLKPEHTIESKYKADIYLLSWKRIPLIPDNYEKDSHEILMQKRANRQEWEAGSDAFSDMITETFIEKAKKQKLKIRPLSVEEIEDSEEIQNTGMKRVIKREKASSTLRERLKSRRKIA